MKTVKVNSTICIKIYGPLSQKVVMDKENRKLTVVPTWNKNGVLIQPGTHEYPLEIIEWKSFKNLLKLKDNSVNVVGGSIESLTKELNKAKKSKSKSSEALVEDASEDTINAENQEKEAQIDALLK